MRCIEFIEFMLGFIGKLQDVENGAGQSDKGQETLVQPCVLQRSHPICIWFVNCEHRLQYTSLKQVQVNPSKRTIWGKNRLIGCSCGESIGRRYFSQYSRDCEPLCDTSPNGGNGNARIDLGKCREIIPFKWSIGEEWSIAFLLLESHCRWDDQLESEDKRGIL